MDEDEGGDVKVNEGTKAQEYGQGRVRGPIGQGVDEPRQRDQG